MTTDITELVQRARINAECGEHLSPAETMELVEALESEKRICATWRKTAEANSEKLEKAQQRIVELENQLKAAENNEIDARCRIAELEESHAQVIQSRDHYKRISEEGLKQLAESRTVTVKLPESFKLAKSSSGLTYYYADEVDAALTAQGIKVEAE